MVSRPSCLQDTGVTQFAPLGDLRGMQPLSTEERAAFVASAGILVLGQQLEFLCEGERPTRGWPVCTDPRLLTDPSWLAAASTRFDIVTGFLVLAPHGD